MTRSLLAASIAIHESKRLTYYPNFTKTLFLAKILSMNRILNLIKSPREVELEIAKNTRLDYLEDFLKLFAQRRSKSIEDIIHERDSCCLFCLTNMYNQTKEP